MDTLTLKKDLPKTIDLFGEYQYYPIQALSWKQPFGTLMLHGKIETRTWNTGYRGPVLICLSQSAYKKEDYDSMTDKKQREKIQKIMLGDDTREMSGVAIAVGELYDTRRMRESDEALAFIKYRPGLFCHFYRNVRRIEPIAFKGGQKWKNVDQQRILSTINFL